MSGNYSLLFLCFFPMVGSIISYLLGRWNKKVRDFFADGVVLVEFLTIVVLFFKASTLNEEPLQFTWNLFCMRGLQLELDGFRVLYGSVAAFMWLLTTIFSREYFAHYRNRNRYYLFMLMTLGATMGVFLSRDLYTTFIFFEVMSFTSYVWVIHEETPEAMRAGQTYLAVAVIGGMVMLMGLFLLYTATGTLDLEKLLPAVHAVWEEKNAMLFLSGALMVFGFGAKAGMFPLHIWLPKAHPVAPAPASALLSGMLTKCGVFGILAVTSNIFLHNPTWGFWIEMIGVVTMFLGALLAVFSINLKRTLACSSMSQIGFILVGVGMQCLLGEENALAVRGTLLHMVNHSLIKLDLFMVAGAVYMNLHKLDLNAIRGFGRKKPLLMFSFLMGALGIGGIPLWNGYVSKTLLHEAIVEYTELLHHHGGNVALFKTIEWIFLISGGMTVAYMTKLFVCLFVEENNDKKKQKTYDEKKNYWSKESMVAIVLSACVLPILGFTPYLTMDRLADLGQEFMHGEAPLHKVHYFAWGNLKGGLISIAIGAFLYLCVIRTLLMKKNEEGKKEYINAWPEKLDLENLVYRPLVEKLFPTVFGAIFSFLDRYFISVPFVQKVLPTVFGTIFSILDKYIIQIPVSVFVTAGTFLTRVESSLGDWVIAFLRKTTHKQLGYERSVIAEDKLAYTLGVAWDDLDEKLHHDGQEHPSHVAQLMESEEKIVRTFGIIKGSFAFGLLLAAIGLMAVLIYVLMAS